MDRGPIVIVGGGMAGFAVARELKQRGNTRDVLMLTADKGSFYAKPLLSHGLSRATPAAALLMPPEKAASANQVRVVAHTEVVHADFKAKTVYAADGRAFTYGDLVVATGATPLNLWQGDGIFSVNSASDMSRLEPALNGAKTVLIAGAGFVGLEFANDWSRAGKQVTVVSVDGPLRPLVPESVSAWVEENLTRAGVHFVRGRLTPMSEGTGLCVEVDGNRLAQRFDLMLSAVGLGADVTRWNQAGLVTGRHGIVVNAHFETNIAHVYAVGDVMEYQGRAWRFVTALNQAAKVIASNLHGQESCENLGVLPISLKCPDSPLAMVLPRLQGEGMWETKAGDADLEATYRQDGKLKGFVLGGTAANRRRQFEEELVA